jgi:hypothetical protein
MNFKKINSITGWVIFVIASAVYLLTIEPTASFWDCGEFISSAYKLEVGHPPGAPFFMLVARIFTMFAGGNAELVARMVNIFSALCSGFTILLLFWTITHLGRKITGATIDNLTPVQIVSIIGSGITGALAYTFSDTFWFSAVEGEVYAFSSLFTALVFWAILRWEDEVGQPCANRWLVLIAYLMGLSIGVHLLNLLAIPAIGLVYYFRKYPVTTRGTVYALLISAAILLVILYVIIPGVVQVAVWFELLFVNEFGLPMNTGTIVYAAVFTGAIVYGLYYSLKNRKIILNSAILMVTVIIIGYASYAALIIRSNAEPPMDQNNPQNLMNLQYYLNREQYGDRPLISGPYYNSPAVDYKEGKMMYAKKDNEYMELGPKIKYKYEKGTTTLFPRMYSTEELHKGAYMEWAHIPANQPKDKIPTFGQNLRFFFSYQLNFMYLRYFLWNFAGRQNDIQGDGNAIHGNWISGITPLDEARLGPQNIPDSLKNRGRNTYYFLPLILGFLGIAFQYQRNRPNFWVVTMLFFMTGIAIVVYLNQTPYQPRERDYAYAGSFYAFAIWIGLGVMGLVESLPEKFRNKYFAAAATAILLLLVPGIMAKENWDDHDRSGRYTARDFAYNYLMTCEPNSIIFTNGDNDTFPLWYMQEVEEVRTDIRVVNLSYLAADWYIDHMNRAAYGSKPLPFSLAPDQYRSGTRDILYIHDRVRGQYSDLKEVMKVVANDSYGKGAMTAEGFLGIDELKVAYPQELRSKNMQSQLSNYIPAKNLMLPVDKEKVLRNGTVALKDSALIEPAIKWSLNDERGNPLQQVYKNSMMVLDLLANNNWERPVYFAVTVSEDNYLNLTDYFQLDGLAYRLVPVKSGKNRENMDIGRIDSEKLYDRMMNQFRWGNIGDPDVYLDETNLRLLTHFRSSFARLANELSTEGKDSLAVQVLDRAFEAIPAYQLPINNITDIIFVQQYYKAGANEKGKLLAEQMFATATQELNYFRKFPQDMRNGLSREIQKREIILWNLCAIAQIHQPDLFEVFRGQWNTIFPARAIDDPAIIPGDSATQ